MTNDLAAISFAAILVAAGIAAYMVALLHPPARSLSLTSFATAVLLYGCRTFAEVPAFRAVAPAGDVPWDYVVAFCTYLLPVVALLFTEHSLGAGWRSSIRRVW